MLQQDGDFPHKAAHYLLRELSSLDECLVQSHAGQPVDLLGDLGLLQVHVPEYPVQMLGHLYVVHVVDGQGAVDDALPGENNKQANLQGLL